MEPKKNPKYDVHKKSRMIFFLSLCLSLLLVLSAFQWKTSLMNLEIEPPTSSMLYEPIYTVSLPEITKPQPVKPIVAKEKPITINPVDPTVAEVPEVEWIDEFPLIPIATINELIQPNEPVDTFLFVETMPSPVDGYDGFYRFLSENTSYPKKAILRHTEGKVFVEFVVNKKGEPANLKIIKGIGYGCDEEALRVIALTQWNPGKQRGNPVNVKMIIPMQFKLNTK